jgi:hypothetical protein
MPDAIMFQEDAYMVLEPDQPEQFMSSEELLSKLTSILASCQADLSRDLLRFPTVSAQAEYLMNTSCEFDITPGQYIHWYVVRLEKS